MTVKDSVEIRLAEVGDKADLLVLHRALYIDHRRSVVPATHALMQGYRDVEGALREDLEALFASRSRRAFLAELDGEVVGYIAGQVDHDPRRILARRAVLEDWFVTAEVRGKGVGRALLETLLAWFKERGCEVVESTTPIGNELARRAHRRGGFEEVEVRFRRRLD